MPNGSPSSRLARSPMWPFASAKIDSVCASTSRSSVRLAHRPRLDRERRLAELIALEQLGEVGDDDVGAVLAQRRRPARRGRRRRRSRSRPARPAATPASASSNTAACVGLDAERPRAGEERVRRRLAVQVLSARDDPVDARLEEVVDPRRFEHLARVRARGDDGAAEARVAWPPGRSGPSRRTSRRPRAAISSSTSSFLRLPSAVDGPGAGRVVGLPSGRSIPRESRNERTPS